jgi:large subunit ribosomal protein L10
MALTKAVKQSLVSGYEQGLAEAPHAFLLSFQGLRVGQADELRKRLREAGAGYEVVKNRLALIAIKGRALDVLAEHFRGETGVAFHNDDPVALAKVLSDFAKDVPAIGFKAGIVDGQVVAGGEVKAIASMPSREELLAKLFFLLQSPITRFVRGLAAIPRQFVVVVDQIAQQKSGGSES